MAASLVVVLFAVGLYVTYYRHVRRTSASQRPDDRAASRSARDDVDPARLDLSRLWRDMATASSLRSPWRFSPEPPLASGAPLETHAEEREATLTRQLFEGTIDAEAYQRQMGELAGHRSATRETR